MRPSRLVFRKFGILVLERVKGDVRRLVERSAATYILESIEF